MSVRRAVVLWCFVLGVPFGQANGASKINAVNNNNILKSNKDRGIDFRNFDEKDLPSGAVHMGAEDFANEVVLDWGNQEKAKAGANSRKGMMKALQLLCRQFLNRIFTECAVVFQFPIPENRSCRRHLIDLSRGSSHCSQF